MTQQVTASRKDLPALYAQVLAQNTDGATSNVRAAITQFCAKHGIV